MYVLSILKHINVIMYSDSKSEFVPIHDLCLNPSPNILIHIANISVGLDTLQPDLSLLWSRTGPR